MKIDRTWRRATIALILAAGLSSPATFADPTTVFTYQGRLTDAGAPASGNFNFTFKVFDAVTDGMQLGPTVSAPSTPVSAGLATVPIDFGASVFTGSPRWLEVSVNGITLTPRQQITPTPYALAAQTLTLPFSGSVSNSGQCAFEVTNTAPGIGGDGICGTTTGGGTTAGVRGEATGGTGVRGSTTSGSAVMGVTSTGVGGNFQSTFNVGVAAWGGSIGVMGSSTGSSGIAGSFSGGQIGVRAVSNQRGIEAFGLNEGVYSEGSSGVVGLSNASNGNGVVGVADSGADAWGVSGASAQGQAVVGRAGPGSLPGGGFPAGTGAVGYSTSANGIGVYGEAASATGTTYAVYGKASSPTGYGGFFLGKGHFSGAVGIGTTNPGSFLLAVNGTAAKPGGGSWSIFCDSRLKHDIAVAAPGTLDKLLSLRAYTFEYTADAVAQRLALPGPQFGLLAEEVERVFPDWVEQDSDGFRYVTERSTTALMVEALRDLRAEKDQQLAQKDVQLADLRARLERLESLVSTNAATPPRALAADKP